jgi:glycine/serine hydroxymethyltransferase
LLNIANHIFGCIQQEKEQMEDFAEPFTKLIDASRKHEKYRDSECINMIASEGLKSPAVREMQSFASDLEGRYAEG